MGFLSPLACSSSSAGRPVIPKRGDKEYEPTGDRGTDLQQYKLDRVRDAMLSALDVERTISRSASNHIITSNRDI